MVSGGIMAQRVINLYLGVVIVVQVARCTGYLAENICNSVVDYDFVVVVVDQVDAVSCDAR